ncbi:pentapeptide repeat-containing protein [Streptomyces sp. 4R-3d]|uniref:pentapeptide repeat-containing protein n=2 Tax=Streptomyces TaxID=1883 RepID=UPI001FFE0514|nr:pentapeptide repeat-containing protein [Streptomyces sp. 4R-3d]
MDWARRIELGTVVVTAVVAVVGLWYSGIQTRQANEQAQQANAQARDDRALAKEGQITDRYTAAVGHLGEEKMDMRLGGIYALQRIMQDSHRDQPTIANVLATYLRTHAAKPPAKGQVVLADVHAALNVLAERDPTHDDGFRPDLRDAQLPGVELKPNDPADPTSGAALSDAVLSNADLSEAFLRGANLINADLRDANLAGADLRFADLSNANLRFADLTGADLINADLGFVRLRGADLINADLSGANLTSAFLIGADLINADLSGADLSIADLSGANLTGANLAGADLSIAKKLTKRQVDSARVDGRTLLPDSLS